MTQITSDDPRLHNIELKDVSRYLRKRGWNHCAHKNPKLLLFQGPNDDSGHPLQIVLPQRLDFVDSILRLTEAINTLALIEDRSSSDIIHSIIGLDRDTLFARVVNGLGPVQLSFYQGVEINQELRGLMSFAACAERNPRPYFEKAANVGREYVEKCVFGHTFPGSFGFTIDSPVSPNLVSDEVPPFERRVIERLIRGLSRAQESILTGDIESLTQKFQDGFNANMYERLVALLTNAGEFTLEFRVNWSPECPVSSDVSHIRAVAMGRNLCNDLEAVARSLRSPKARKPVTIQGRVVQLRSESASEDVTGDADEYVVTVHGQKGSEFDGNVRLFLSPEDYRVACDAHRDRKIVQATGLLEKADQKWTLASPKNFAVLDAGNGTATTADNGRADISKPLLHPR